MSNEIYQVLLTNKETNKIYNVGVFRLHAHATVCMQELSEAVSGMDYVISIWQLVLTECQWDGKVDFTKEFTYSLTDVNNAS